MSHLESLARAPFDLDLFARVSRQKLRRTFGFLALLVAVSTVATTISLTKDLREVIRKIEPEIDKLPQIEIRNGQASVSVEQPWIYRFGNDDRGRQIVLIIDTTGRRQGFARDEIGVFLKRTHVVVKTPDDENEISLKDVPDMVIGPQLIHELIAKWMRRVPFYIGALACLWFVLAKTSQALLLVLAALAGSSSRASLPFRGLFAIGVYALAPVVLLAAARPFLPFAIPYFAAIYCALAIVYAVLGGQRAATSPPPADNVTDL
ncbi:MAG TPA: DUF1189 family protein [Polyangia bacterium]|nr:DUF1189 family protein [Polyangia bacterium]